MNSENNTNYKDKNMVILLGSIARMQIFPSHAVVTIVTDIAGKKLAAKKNEKDSRVYIKTLFFDPKSISSYSVKDTVIVRGHIQQRFVNEKIEQYVAADKISRPKRLLDSFLPGFFTKGKEHKGGMPKDENMCVFIGEVMKKQIISTDSAYIRLKIHESAQNKYHTCQIVLYKPSCFQLKDVEVGGRVAIYGDIQNDKKALEDNNVKEYIVCRDFAILESNK